MRPNLARVVGISNAKTAIWRELRGPVTLADLRRRVESPRFAEALAELEAVDAVTITDEGLVERRDPEAAYRQVGCLSEECGQLYRVPLDQRSAPSAEHRCPRCGCRSFKYVR